MREKEKSTEFYFSGTLGAKIIGRPSTFLFFSFSFSFFFLFFIFIWGVGGGII